MACCLIWGYTPLVIAQNGMGNKVILQTTNGQQELSTSDIQTIRFNGPDVTIVQPWGSQTYNGTVQSLTFWRPLPGMLRLSTEARISDGSSSNAPRRALGLDGEGNLKSTWEEGDQVFVYPDDASTMAIGTLTPETTGAAVSRLTGDIDGTGLADGQILYLCTKARPHSFAVQTGSLGDIFYATATAEVSITGGNATIADATFQPAQAVTRFTLKDGMGNDVMAKQLAITGGEENIMLTISPAASMVYVAMPATDVKTTYTFTATTDDNREWTGTKSANVQTGGYYRANVTLTKVKLTPILTPPTTTSLTYNTQSQTLVNAGSTTGGTLQYKLEGGTYGTSLPTATNAGNYTVYYRVVGNDDYNDVAEQSLSVTIQKATGTISYSTTSTNRGFFDSFTNTLSKTGDGTVTYSSSATSIATVNSTSGLVSVQGAEGQATITATVADGANYTYTTKTRTCKVNVSATYTPFTMQARASGTIRIDNPLSKTIRYKKNNGSYTSSSSNPVNISVSNGDRVCFLTSSNVSTYANGNSDNQNTHFVSNPSCYVYGNLGSLISPNFASGTYSTISNYLFCHLFKSNTSIFNYSGRKLVLPMTSLSEYCYAGMFQGCAGLTQCPELPALTMKSHCYTYMFSECTAITQAPELPATTTDWNCYDCMFTGCTSLTKAPLIKADRLAEQSCRYMFHNCPKLSYVKCLATSVASGANGACYNWMWTYSSGGTFVKKRGTTVWSTGVHGIPSDWTVQEADY